MKIGQTFKRLRKDKKIRQCDFAIEVGISQTYLSLIERNRREPTLATLNKIADKLEIPLSLIFWLALEEEDIKEGKKDAFNMVKPIMDQLVNGIINENDEL